MALVIGDEAVEEARLPDLVGPGDEERHLLLRVHTLPCEPPELHELFPRSEPEHEPGRSHPEVVEGRDVDHWPSFRGWPITESSAMSRRKRSETVQSATTRSFRVRSGSWYRW